MNMKFDFRTKLLVIVLTMSLVAVLTSDILIYTLLGVLSVYLIIQGFGRQTIKYLIVCGIFIVLRLLSGGQGITILMPEMFLFMVLRILMMVMAAQPVIGMPPGEVVAVFKKIHAPDGIALPVTFMLRFFPTVRSEFSDVFASLRLRKLLRKEPLTDRQAQRIETIFHKAERMKELVQTFYDLSILDAEQITPRREDFNLSNLLINLITENAPALEAKNISPEIDLPPHSVYLNSDYSMVERILQNLLTNAIRYSSGDIKMSLKQARENRAIFTIENPIDSKTEINPARLFERFYTGDASRHNSGTGVGLAVVKLLTDKLGGNVSAEIKSNVLTVTLEIQ